MATAPNAADRAVMVHLVRLIQDSADVRYYVGGPLTEMRNLLCKALTESGFDGDPREALNPPEHRKNERPHVERLQDEIERLENGIERLRVILLGSDDRRARDIVERLQSGEAVR